MTASVELVETLGSSPVETSGERGTAPLRLASRRSALALTQSRWVAEQLAEATNRPLELVGVVTQGDTDRSSLAVIGGLGVFVAAVREALLDGAADLAVHSLKDLPSQAADGLALSAVPPREDPRDALVARDGLTLATLPTGARVGTGSPRRRAQLLDARPDLQIVDLRGNVDTRLARVLGDAADGTAPDLDAVVLALAGLTRLGRTDVITEILDPAVMTPAPGQGALAVETRTDPDPDLAAALATLEHSPTRAAVTAERALLATLGTGCTLPVGALAHLDPETGTLHLHAVLAGEDGSIVRRTGSAPPDRAEDLGAALANELITEAAALARRTQGDPPPTRRESP